MTKLSLFAIVAALVLPFSLVHAGPPAGVANENENADAALKPLPVPDLPANAKTLDVSLRVYELNLSEDDAAATAEYAAAIAGERRVFSPEEGAALFGINKQGVDVLTAPRVVTQAGQRAKVEIIREFIYPSEMTEDEGSGERVPGEFKTVPIGVMIELEARPTSNPRKVRMKLEPIIREFKGFRTSEKEPELQVPVFESRGKPIEGTYENGSYFVVGHREDIQSIEDKVPLLGSIPLIGKLFRESSTQRLVRLAAVQVIAAEAVAVAE